MEASQAASTRRRTLVSTASIVALGGSLLAFAADARADVNALRPLDPTLGFTVFVERDATVTRNENDGTMALGGDLTLPEGGAYNVGNNADGRWTAQGDARPTALYVGGRVDFDGGHAKVLHGNYARIVDGTRTRVIPNGGVTHVRHSDGGGNGIDINTEQPAGSVLGPVGNPIDFPGAFATLRRNAAAIGRCEANLTTTNANGAPTDWDGEQLNVFVRLAAGRTNVLNLTSAQLRKIQTITFREGVPGDASLLINVMDWTNGEWQVPNYSGVGKSEASRILINFPTATALTLVPNSASVEGTIYAPGAAVTIDSRSNVDGSVVVGALAHVGGGEIHDAPFAPPISCASPEEPEPREPGPREPQPREPGPREPQPREPEPRQPEPRQPAPSQELTGTTPQPVAPSAPQPRGEVKGRARSGRGRPQAKAALAGTVGCVKDAAQAKVSGSQLRAVEFRLNGRVLKRVRLGGRRGTALRIPAARLAAGANTLTARVSFTRASGARAKTLRLGFVRCATGAVKPQYTG